MCTCVSCKLTDSYSSKGFDVWPKAEGMRPLPAKLKDPVYDAHWRYCGAKFYAKPAGTAGSPFPCTGTRQVDPRAAYSFPGGQVGKVKRYADAPMAFPRRDELARPQYVDDTAGYVAAFTAANHLINIFD
jgi:hypothetical protein